MVVLCSLFYPYVLLADYLIQFSVARFTFLHHFSQKFYFSIFDFADGALWLHVQLAWNTADDLDEGESHCLNTVDDHSSWRILTHLILLLQNGLILSYLCKTDYLQLFFQASVLVGYSFLSTFSLPCLCVLFS